MLGDTHGHANSIFEPATCDAFQISIHSIPALCDWGVGLFSFNCFHLVLPSENWLRWFLFVGKWMIAIYIVPRFICSLEMNLRRRMHVRTFNISLKFALYRLFVANKNRPHWGVQAMLLLGCSLFSSDYCTRCEKQRWNNVYVTIPIEIAGTVKLIATPVGVINLIVGICLLRISNYIILLRSNNA